LSIFQSRKTFLSPHSDLTIVIQFAEDRKIYRKSFDSFQIRIRCLCHKVMAEKYFSIKYLSKQRYLYDRSLPMSLTSFQTYVNLDLVQQTIWHCERTWRSNQFQHFRSIVWLLLISSKSLVTREKMLKQWKSCLP